MKSKTILMTGVFLAGLVLLYTGHRIQGLAGLGIMILGLGLLLGDLYLYNAAQR